MNERLPIEWNGRIIRRREDGYFNATDMCEACGRRFNDWHTNAGTKAFLSALERQTGIPVNKLIQSVTGVGTYVHPDVATALAMWCEPEFHVFVVGLVRQWAEGRLVVAPIEETREQRFARVLIEAQGVIAERDAQIAVLFSKANGFDHIAKSEGSLNLTDAAKTLGKNPKEFIGWLHEYRWIYRRQINSTGRKGEWVGHQDRVRRGDLEHTIIEIQRADGTCFSRAQVLITMRGLARIAKIFGNATM